MVILTWIQDALSQKFFTDLWHSNTHANTRSVSEVEPVLHATLWFSVIKVSTASRYHAMCSSCLIRDILSQIVGFQVTGWQFQRIVVHIGYNTLAVFWVSNNCQDVDPCIYRPGSGWPCSTDTLKDFARRAVSLCMTSTEKNQHADI